MRRTRCVKRRLRRTGSVKVKLPGNPTRACMLVRARLSLLFSFLLALTLLFPPLSPLHTPLTPSSWFPSAPSSLAHRPLPPLIFPHLTFATPHPTPILNQHPTGSLQIDVKTTSPLLPPNESLPPRTPSHAVHLLASTHWHHPLALASQQQRTCEQGRGQGAGRPSSSATPLFRSSPRRYV